MYAAIENKVTLIEKMIRLGNPVNHFNKVQNIFLMNRKKDVLSTYY